MCHNLWSGAALPRTERTCSDREMFRMNAANASKEIADLNLTYMLLAQRLLRQDRPAAMLRLGISPEMADLLIAMSLAEVIKIIKDPRKKP